jgi:hypothetical protein
MSWRIRHHYGHGAANVELAAEPHFVAHRSLSMRGALVDAGRDFYLSTLPPLLLAVFMITALFVTVSEDKGYTDLEVVMVQDELVPLEEEILEPEVVPEPEPEPVEVVEKKPEPPPPVKKPAPKPEPPPVQKIARVKPKPPPVARVKPKPPPRARPKPRPVVKPKMQALALQPEPQLAPPPPRRGNRVREQVQPKPMLAPLANAPKLVDESQPDSSRRFAAVRAPSASRRPKADLGPPIAARALDAPVPAPPPARTRRAAPRNETEKRQMAKVSFAASSAPAPAAPKQTRSLSRRDRPVAAPSRNRHAAPPPMDLAAAAPAAPSTSLPAAPRRTERAHTERNDATRTRADHTGSRSLAGVPLASLAACVSEREEEALKRKLVAAVTTQRECVSRAGTYRFVETKNLNAFLMTIERSANRSEGDRCVELRHALQCVTR